MKIHSSGKMRKQIGNTSFFLVQTEDDQVFVSLCPFNFHRSKKTENWDLFEVLPPDKDSDLDEDQKIYNLILKTLKVVWK